MKTFLLDIIPKIQRFSQKLDNATTLTNKHWVVIDEEHNRKIVFIFRDKDNQLLISDNGKIEKGSWENLGNNSLLIDRKDGSFLFKHGFIDDTVLALKVDGKEEYALLVNEDKFDNKINTLSNILDFLTKTYDINNGSMRLPISELKTDAKSPQLATKKNNKIKDFNKELPISKLETKADSRQLTSKRPNKDFNIDDYPELTVDLKKIQNILKKIGNEVSTDIIIAFCKGHSVKTHYIKKNPELMQLLVARKVPVELIEQLFWENSENLIFLNDLEIYLKENIARTD